MKVRKSIFIVVVCTFIVGSFLSTFKILSESAEFEKNRKKYTEAVLFTEGLLSPLSWLPVGSWEEKLERAEVFKKRSNHSHQVIVENGWALGLGALLAVLITVLLFYNQPILWKNLSISLLIISVIALVVGISTPMMELAAFNTDLTIPFNFSEASESIPAFEGMLEFLNFEVTFDGRMYYYYQSKSILGLIRLLFDQGNYLVGLAILMFSIILPVTKLLCTFGQLFSTKLARNKAVNFITNYMGKWSMADVFVVALFLGYFSFSNMSVGIETQTEALIGLYCFGSYVLLSILTTHFVYRSRIKQELA